MTQKWDKHPPRCDEPHPYLATIRCDYHKGHGQLKAIGGGEPPTIYAHGNGRTRRWWTDNGVCT